MEKDLLKTRKASQHSCNFLCLQVFFEQDLEKSYKLERKRKTQIQKQCL